MSPFAGWGVFSCSPVVALLLLVPLGQGSVATMNMLQLGHGSSGGGEGDAFSIVIVSNHCDSPNTPLIGWLTAENSGHG